MPEDKKKKKKKEEVDDDDGMPTCPFWMLTFGDAMSLLLTFFVMLVSFTSFDEMKVGGFIGSVYIAFGGSGLSGRGSGFEKVEEMTELLSKNNRALSFREREKVISKLNKLKKYIKKQGDYDIIKMERVKRGISIRIQNNLLFEKGSDELKPESRDILRKISIFLSFIDNPIVVEGHTDNIPVRYGGKFKDNWDISLHRAITVAKLLEENEVEGNRLAVAGLADLKPIKPNDTKENRAKNRRVEIIIIGRTPDYSSM